MIERPRMTIRIVSLLPRDGRESAGEYRVYLPSPVFIGMLGQYALQCGVPNRLSPLGTETAKCSATSSPLRATRTSRPGSRNRGMPSQSSVMRHAPAPAASKTRVARAESVACHAFAADVQHRAGRGVERIVLCSADMPDVAHVRRHRPFGPSVAPQ